MDYQREEIATLQINQGENEEAVVIVGVFPGRNKIALCVSSRENEDTEIYLSPEDCEKVAKFLREALSRL